jgi:hypothetical protein
MHIFIVAIILIIISPIQLFSKSYIRLTTQTPKQKLFIVKKRLSRFGLNMVFKQNQNGNYIIYSGPYSSEKYAIYLQQKVKKYFPNAIVLTKNQKKIIHHQKKVIKNKKTFYPYFVSIGIGYSSTPSTHMIKSGTVTINKPKVDGISYNIGFGYLMQNFVFALNYMRIDTKDLLFNNTFGEIGYRFKQFYKYRPYFAAIAGYSSLKWSINPIDNASVSSNNDSKSPFYGTKAGIIYDFYKNVELYSSYQCIFMQHTTNLEVGSSNISKLQHNISHTIEFGLNYKF